MIACACLCLCGIETAVAFAGENGAFLVQFVGAVVMLVSVVPCSGRAEASSVSMSPFLRPVREVFRPGRPGVGASVK